MVVRLCFRLSTFRGDSGYFHLRSNSQIDCQSCSVEVTVTDSVVQHLSLPLDWIPYTIRVIVAELVAFANRPAPPTGRV